VRSAPLFLLCVLLAGCASVPALNCPGALTLGSPLDVPAFDQLDLRFRRLASALCTCNDVALLTELVPKMAEDSNSSYCPGPLRILSVEMVGPTLVAIMLTPRLDGTEEDADATVVFASLVDSAWYFSWPAEKGPPLHP
jgi:hypothetical protein